MTILKHEITDEEYRSVPDNLRPIYAVVEGQEGTFAIPEPLRGVADAITGLFGTNSNIRKENKELQRKGTLDLSALSEYGDNVTTIAESVSARIAELEEAATKGDTKAAGQLEKMRTELKAAHSKELEGRDSTINALRSTVHRYLVTSGATEALAAEGGNPELALPFVEKNIRVDERDGQFIPVVVDADGDPRISGGTGQPMTVRELVKEMKQQEKFAPLFRSDSKGGGGAKPGAPAKPVAAAANIAPIDRIKAGLAARAR